VLPKTRAQWVALISFSIALSQTPANTAGPQTQGYDDDDVDDDDNGRINFNVAYSPKTSRTRDS